MYAHLSAGDVCRKVLALQDARPFRACSLWRAESFRQTGGEPMTVRRALALNAVLDRCDLPLIPGELLFGSGTGRFQAEGGESALAEASGYLETIGGRDFSTNVDHCAPDYPALLALGFGGLKGRAVAALQAQTDPALRAFQQSVIVALDGAARHIRRWAGRVRSAAGECPEWADLLLAQAEMLERIAREPPVSFHQALQLVFLTHCIWQLDDRFAMAFGRIDQYLYPFYQADTECGRLTGEDVQTLLDHVIAKLAHRWDIQNICAGGVDAEGHDATNALSFMLVEAVQRIGQPGGNLTVRIHAGTPDAFLLKCAECIRTGIGFPAVFNDDVEIPALVGQGYPLADARDYCFVGCIEVFQPGRQAPWSDSRFNLLRCVDLALRGGRDGLTGEQAGPDTGEPASWEDFCQAFLAQMRHGVAEHVRWFNAHKQEAEDHAGDLTSPLLSALTADCINRALDLNAGGARYPANHGIAGMGIGCTADSLMAIKRFVYDTGRFTLGELRAMLDADFKGFEAERRLFLHGAPKYGNDDDEVDSLAVEAARAFGLEILKNRTPRGGRYWALMGANISNIPAGRQVGATPDGRFAFQPLSDAASPTFGRDTHGATAAARSVAKLHYSVAPGGNVVNMKLHPAALAGEEGVQALAALIRGCFRLGGIQLQFNTTDREILKKAMEHPEDYRSLVVRVSGFSAYFVGLDPAVQEDILARTEHSRL